jgi:hypothetical protein
MSNKRLLDRQASLVEYLTSSAAIFGDDGGAPADRDLHVFDLGRLRLEARFSHEKRMRKIEAVFPRTLGFLARGPFEPLEAFARACAPRSIRRYDNARQFYQFLQEIWRREAPTPPYLTDVAAYELAIAKVRSTHADREPEYAGARPALRRHPRVELLILHYDIRDLFEDNEEPIDPGRGDFFLAMTLTAGAFDPSVIQVSQQVFELLRALDGWIPVAASGLVSEAKDIVAQLVGAGFLEAAE